MLHTNNYTLKQIDILHLFWCKEKYLFGTKLRFLQCNFCQKEVSGRMLKKSVLKGTTRRSIWMFWSSSIEFIIGMHREQV